MANRNVFALLNDDVEDVDAGIQLATKEQAPAPPAREVTKDKGTRSKPPRREHDRHVSGTGRGREVSKGGGGGKYTFGSSKSDARAATNAANKALQQNGDEKSALEAASAATSTAPDAAEEEKAGNEDDETNAIASGPQKPLMTLQEYRAVQNAEKVDINSLLGSEPAEHVDARDDAEFANMTALKKGDDGEGDENFSFVVEGTKKKGQARVRDTTGKGMSMQQFMQQGGSQANGAGNRGRRDGGGGRGGHSRGGGRGGGAPNRGGSVGGNSRSSAAPNVTDLSSFPKLGL